MTVEQAIAELKSDIELYKTDICKPGDGSPDGDLMEALEMAIAALEKESEWISVDDAHPVENGWYFVYAPSYRGGSSSGKESAGNVMFSKWSGKNWSIEVGYHKRPGCVTHWMAIPKPPEVKE